MRLSALMKRQPATEEMIPKIGRPVSAHVTSFENDRAMVCIRLPGMAFESVSAETLENRFDSLNAFLAGLALEKGNRLAIWTTFRRRRTVFDESYAFRSTFMQQFSTKYLERFRGVDFYENAFFMTMVLKHNDIAEGVTELEELAVSVKKTLSVYDPEILKVYDRNGIMFSETYEFLGELLNGVEERMPVTDAPGYEIIPTAWTHFGYDVMELRTTSSTKFATCYDLKDFPRSGWGQFNPLLTLPMEFTLTQSFVFMGTYEAQKEIETQKGKLTSVGDKAISQIKELNTAQGDITSREIAFGTYHAALVVFGSTAAKAVENGTSMTARSLNECGVRWLQATLSAPITFLSQIPGYPKKPRPMPKSTRNLAASFSMHNYSSGKSRGNPLGDGRAVMPLQTVGKGRYDFSFHASRPDEDNTGEKVAGHTLMIGATGVGKTTTQLAMVGFLDRFDPKIFALDLDRGMEIFLQNMGAAYFPLKAGVPTGLAPFELPDTEQNRQFLYSLVRACGKDVNGKTSAEDNHKIKVGVDAIFALTDIKDRIFSRLLESIPEDGTPNCLALRLSKWCHAADGEFAWALDNVPGTMLDVATQHRIGFDVSDFLKKDYEPAEPVLAYLFHLKNLMQSRGGLLVTIIEEFWLPARYPVTQDLMLKSLKTGRKIEEFVILVSQSPEDALNCPIASEIIQQTATKIYLPNPDAKWESYEKCNMTRREFDQYKRLEKESRTFLIKQSHQSAFAMLDLHGMSDELAVLSGSTDNIAIWEDVWREYAPALDVAMTIFHERRKGKKSSSTIVEGDR